MFAACAVVVVGAGCGAPDSEPLPPPATTLVALDGADWRNAIPLIRQGKLPTMEALRAAGTVGTMLTNEDYSFSPVLWTTVATGKLPEQHGVVHFMARWEGIERAIPTPSLARRVKALWNLFTEADVPSAFVGWWVTWPAEPILGFMVSDHFSVSRFDLGQEFDRDVADAAFHSQQTFPPNLVKDLAHLKVARQEIRKEDFARYADLPDEWQPPATFEKFEKFSEFAIAHSVDRTHDAVARKLLTEHQPPLLGVFYQGVDIMQHFFWEFMDPDGAGTAPAPEDIATFGPAIERYYEHADGLLNGLVESASGPRSILIVSDHGFLPSQERWADKGISGEHRRQAFFLFAGPGVERGARTSDMDAVDVAPTVLAYHGLAVANDMDGTPAVECFTDAWLDAHPIVEIETYETEEWVRGELPDASVARDLEERIRALGYIE